VFTTGAVVSVNELTVSVTGVVSGASGPSETSVGGAGGGVPKSGTSVDGETEPTRSPTDGGGVVSSELVGAVERVRSTTSVTVCTGELGADPAGGAGGAIGRSVVSDGGGDGGSGGSAGVDGAGTTGASGL
jgi:hypothetical protein